MSQYKLVVKFAPYGTDYHNPDGSVSKSIGHIWYEVYNKNNMIKPLVSAGWSSGDYQNPLTSKSLCTAT